MSDKKDSIKKDINYSSFLEKEILHNSIIQKELLKTIKELSKTIKENTDVLKIIEKHEYFSIHKSKIKIALYNILLGVLFAIGTVFGLLIISWFTYNFFKDSEALKNIVDNQLKIRQLNIGEMKEKIKNEIKSDFKN